MTWNDITVEQYQKIYPIISDEAKILEDKKVEVVSMLSDKSIEQLDELTIGQFNEIAKDYSFLFDGTIKGEAKQRIKANGNTYQVQTDVKKMPFARYVEVKHYRDTDFIKNLHLILASIVKPVKESYDVKRHGEYASDMLKANFADCYQVAVFFCALYSNVIKTIPHYLISELTSKTTITKEQATETIEALCITLDGITTQSKSLISIT